MLVRLLDAFVWRNHGALSIILLELVVEPQLSGHRPPGDTATRFHIRPRNERTCCPIPVHNALRTRSIFLLCQVHRRIVPPLRAANTRRGTQRSQGLFVITPQWRSMNGRVTQLLDRCLKIVDPELFSYLRMKNLSAEIYAFPCLLFSRSSPSSHVDESQFLAAVLTLCACTPPLDQVLMLWDFLLAFGVHLNVLCVIAQLLLMREEVMSSPRFDLFVLRAAPRSYHSFQPYAPLTNFSSTRSCSSCWDSGHARTGSACRSL